VKNQDRLFSVHHCFGSDKKPIEIYLFIDPVCAECWELDPILKKLQIEYGRYFSLKYVLSGKLTDLNIRKKRKCDNRPDPFERTASQLGLYCDRNLRIENPAHSPFIASIAIKAAELQGRKAGNRFLRLFHEVLLLETQDITNFEVLKDCAKKAGLDVEEFILDIHSKSAAKAFQCDLKITSEMDVSEMPTLVFFNENAEEEGIKIAGVYPYEIYVQILEEMLSEQPHQSPPPPLEAFMKFFKLVDSKDISIIYNMPIAQVDREMKKLLLKQKVEQILARNRKFWRYIEE
jgi:predicted DsbA family dithiol-disulfide isomerase